MLRIRERLYAGEMCGLFPIVMVNNGAFSQSAHCPAHASRVDDKSPCDLIEEVSGTGHDENADGEKDDSAISELSQKERANGMLHRF